MIFLHRMHFTHVHCSCTRSDILHILMFTYSTPRMEGLLLPDTEALADVYSSSAQAGDRRFYNLARSGGVQVGKGTWSTNESLRGQGRGLDAVRV